MPADKEFRISYTGYSGLDQEVFYSQEEVEGVNSKESAVLFHELVYPNTVVNEVEEVEFE